MGGAKPTLGYPSRTAACVALNKRGLTDRQIADKIGIEPGTVAALRHSARRTGERSNFTINLSSEASSTLRMAATGRAIQSTTLIERLIEVICADDMFDAVLDEDAGGSAPREPVTPVQAPEPAKPATVRAAPAVQPARPAENAVPSERECDQVMAALLALAGKLQSTAFEIRRDKLATKAGVIIGVIEAALESLTAAGMIDHKFSPSGFIITVKEVE